MAYTSANSTNYKVSKYNNLVVCQVSTIWLKTIVANTWTQIATVPSGSRPVGDSGITVSSVSEANHGHPVGFAKVEVLTSGLVRVKSNISYSNTEVFFSFNLSWFIS